MTALTQTFNPTNREQKRAVLRERKRLLMKILEVEFYMYNLIFDEPNADYNEAYKHCLSQYIALKEWILKYIKPKYHTVNEHYFEQIFKPLEELTITN